MGYFTELFSRPRPSAEARRVQKTLCFLESMSRADMSDIGIKPADFPRIAREMAARSAQSAR